MAIDWTQGMEQSFVFCEVDPISWDDSRVLAQVQDATLKMDSGLETLGNASLTVDGEVGEVYVRAYLAARQGNNSERVPLGTYIVQTPTKEMDGRRASRKCACYTPLLEAKEKYPAIGAVAANGRYAEECAAEVLQNALRAPVTPYNGSTVLHSTVVAEPSQKALEFARKLLDIADVHLTLDGFGHVGIAPNIEPSAAQPRWTFRDDEASIIKGDKRETVDWYGIPNVVEVIWSGARGTVSARAVNSDTDSPLSTVGRGREVVHRITSPALTNPSAADVQAYAERELRNMCAMERTEIIKHGWCGVRVGDCVRLDLDRDGIHANGIITAQTIICKTGCTVESTVKWTESLWR